MSVCSFFFFFFFFNDTATTEIYTLSLHDALPISSGSRSRRDSPSARPGCSCRASRSRRLRRRAGADRKSTRLNSSHTVISYAVFCLKKKKKQKNKEEKNKKNIKRDKKKQNMPYTV